MGNAIDGWNEALGAVVYLRRIRGNFSETIVQLLRVMLERSQRFGEFRLSQSSIVNDYHPGSRLLLQVVC